MLERNSIFLKKFCGFFFSLYSHIEVMSALSSLCPVLHSLSSHKLSWSPLPSLQQNNLPIYPHQNHPRICASLSKKPRGSRRAVKSNEDLCKDIKGFLSAAGLPQDHVPSMKELSEHGRQDLANIVRRRGYKFIRELLTSSAEIQINGSCTEEKLTGEQDICSEYEGISTGQQEKVKDASDDISLSSEANKREQSLAKDASISTEVDIMEFAEDLSFSIGTAGANLLQDNVTVPETNRKLDSDNDISSGPESSIYPSLQGKVAKFIQDGDLDDIEEDSRAITESQNAIESNSVSTPGQQNDPVFYGAEIIKGNTALPSHQVEHPAMDTNSSRMESHSTEIATIDCKKDQEVEAQKVENQAEINRLKFILHQKELELNQLKEEIEKEKLALSTLQTKADREISRAQKLILEKDAELQAAEETLSGLQEVEIQYCGEGEVVEVAGSFNGWHQKIKMDSQPSSSISDLIGSQKSRLWRTMLWLYPGVYEIKFIVDGRWTVDPQRESVTRATIHNNILRVIR
ncbi:hypothetical protein ACH5RR_004695 [Cinchona calisaya]|uniref:AMP-activated protein kinase glycogen-binding domain-containing protein n=1 Tax=Cinchona calisaya TaxID=153742 RepID=A0ABD3AYC2_9GENT